MVYYIVGNSIFRSSKYIVLKIELVARGFFVFVVLIVACIK